MSRPTVFISRDDRRAKAFIDIVQPYSGLITCQSLLEFTLVESTGLPQSGWLFFYSQSGVEFFFKQHSQQVILEGNLKIGAFGSKTAQFLIEQGVDVQFVGTGEAKTTSMAFLAEVNGAEVCFIKGTKSKESMTPYLQGHLKLSFIDVYQNRSKDQLDLPPSDILVFTSPLNLQTYCMHYPIDALQKVVVIGTSTAATALDVGVEEVHIPPQPSLESLGSLVLELCDTWSGSM